MITARGAKIFVSAAFALALLADAGLANAKVLRWELQNVVFDDGGTASGFFLFDAPAYNLADWDITVEAGTAVDPPGYRFHRSASIGFVVAPENKILVTRSSHGEPAGSHIIFLQLQLYFDHPLSDAGGRAALIYGFEGWTYCCNERYITGGEVVAVPEPSEGLFLALGLATLVGFSTQRRH